MTSHFRAGPRAACLVLVLAGLPGLGFSTDAAADAGSTVAPLIERLGLEESATPVRERAGWQRPKKVLLLNLQPQLLPTLQPRQQQPR